MHLKSGTCHSFQQATTANQGEDRKFVITVVPQNGGNLFNPVYVESRKEVIHIVLFEVQKLGSVIHGE